MTRNDNYSGAGSNVDAYRTGTRLVLYLVYLETSIDLPPSDHFHHRRAAHRGRPVQDASNLHYAAVRRIA